MSNVRVYFATDHAGFELKEALKAYVQNELCYDVKDFGAHEYNVEDDYPDFVFPLARAIANDGSARGIILGGSGQGEAMAANRVRHVRACVWYGGEKEIVTLSREHNDANVLSLGARFVTEKEAKEVVSLWLAHAFSGAERHERRNEKLDCV